MSSARVFIEASAVPATYEVFESLLLSHLAGDSRRGTAFYSQAAADTPLYQYLERYAIENEISVFYPYELQEGPTHHIAFVCESELKTFKLMQLPNLLRKPSIIIISDERNAL